MIYLNQLSWSMISGTFYMCELRMVFKCCALSIYRGDSSSQGRQRGVSDRKSERNDCEWRGRCSSCLFITRSRLRGFYPIFLCTTVQFDEYARRTMRHRGLLHKKCRRITILRMHIVSASNVSSFYIYL